MIKHIVLWKLDESYTESEKEAIITEMKKQLTGLKGKIDTLKYIRVYTNQPGTPISNYDISLDTEFSSVEDLNTYQEHPEHKKVVAAIGPYKKQRAAIDYPI